jgi:putative phage-type endonuclease
MTQTDDPPVLTYPTGAVLALPAGAPEADWHATRATGIGGSDIAAICGLNPYTSPLEIWFTKVGQPVPRADNPTLNEAALMGHILEPIVALRFTSLTDLPIIDNPGTLRRPDIPWALVNLDRATFQDGRPGVVECKTRSSYALNDWLDEPPVDVQVQVQWQLMVTGWAYGYVACLIGGQRTIVHRIDRDQQLIDDLLAIGAEFWEQVETRTQPPIDGSVATGQLLDRLHANAVDEVVVADATEVEGWLRQRATAKEQIAAAEIAVTDAENHLKAIAGDATEVHIRGEKAFSWRPRRGQISWKSVALELDPDVDPEPHRGKPTRTLTVHMEDL